MQYALPFEIENRLVSAHDRLLAAYGPIPPCIRLDPVSQMIFAMLSGRTRDEIAMETFRRFKNRLGPWENLADIQPYAVEGMIAGVTFAEKKAVYLTASVEEIMRRCGRLDLDFLADWPVDKAQAWLENLFGVGAKTSTAVLNFSTLHRRVLMVDTAHNRVARRLRLVPPKASIARSTRLLNRQIPEEWTAGDTETHHVRMQELGKIICTHAHPRCPQCPLNVMCPPARDAMPAYEVAAGAPGPSLDEEPERPAA